MQVMKVKKMESRLSNTYERVIADAGYESEENDA